MTAPNSRRDLIVALLIAAWAHVGVFFFFVLLLFFDLLSATAIDQEEAVEKNEPSLKMQMVYAEEPALVEAPAAEPEEKVVEVPPEAPAFVQTNEDQASEVAPEETPLIGERNTLATSDEGAVAGDEKRSALAGEVVPKSDPKTFDSSFSEGENSGPQVGESEMVESGEGSEPQTVEASVAQSSQPESLREGSPEVADLEEEIEELPKPPEDQLASIDETLAALDEVIGDQKREQRKKAVPEVAESPPEKPAEKAQEAAAQDGGFAPKSQKTRIAGVFNAQGKGSLNVADTAAGRYEASILKKLERAWQMDNINNRSLNAPGQITIYFAVGKKGQVSHQRHIARVGASDNQWGRILGIVDLLAIPKMPQAVIQDLKGEALELVVTFNY